MPKRKSKENAKKANKQLINNSFEINKDNSDSDNDYEDLYEDELEEEEIVNEDELNEDENEEENEKIEIWDPAKRPLQEGETLEYDSSAYLMYHSFQLDWPCLSFDIIKDNLGIDRTRV